MKKYSSILTVFVVFALIFAGFLAFNTTPAHAWDSGCYGSNIYSVTTGQPCNAGNYYNNYSNTYAIPGCYGTNAYSTTTGQYCNNTQSSYYSNTTYTNTYPTYPTYPASYQNTYTNSYSNNSYQNSVLPNLSVGSTGTYVSAVQQVLKNQGYYYGNVDGSFGPITEAAVVRYQQAFGLPATGVVDTATYIKLGILVPQTTQPAYPTYPTYPTQPTCSYGYLNGIYQNICNGQGNSGSQYGAPIISYVTPTSGAIGSQVTITGTNLANSTINFGGYTITPSYSTYNQITFTVPTSLNNCYSGQYCTNNYIPVNTGNYNIYVTNSYGTSNTVSFNVYGSSYGSGTPTISYLSPTAGPIGRQVIINGINLTGGTVSFGGYTIPSTYLSSTQISFIVPYNLNNCPVGASTCPGAYIPVNMQNYNISVTTSYGLVSNSMNFLVTSY